MVTVLLPLNTSRRLSSALMLRLSFLSCRSCFLTYAQIFFTTSLRGIGLSAAFFSAAARGVIDLLTPPVGLPEGLLSGILARLRGASRARASRWGGISQSPRALRQ